MADFDKKAPDYDAWYVTPMGALVDQLETDCAFRLFDVPAESLVLDAGCGTGNFSMKLAKKGNRVHGVDVSEPMLEVARNKVRSENVDITFHHMDVYKLDFPNETFDAVFSMAAFEFIEHPQDVLQEFFRVTKPGGHVLVGTITGDSSWGLQYRSQMERPDSVFHHAHFKTAEEMTTLFPDRLIDHETCVFFPPNAPDEALSLELEKEWSKKAKGAFVCVLWEKPFE